MEVISRSSGFGFASSKLGFVISALRFQNHGSGQILIKTRMEGGSGGNENQTAAFGAYASSQAYLHLYAVM
jgi:xanthine dehydrogenase molybdopterin-binding subunit B